MMSTLLLLLQDVPSRQGWKQGATPGRLDVRKTKGASMVQELSYEQNGAFDLPGLSIVSSTYLPSSRLAYSSLSSSKGMGRRRPEGEIGWSWPFALI
jgi:hypothetical protein